MALRSLSLHHDRRDILPRMNYRTRGWKLLAVAAFGGLGWWIHNLIRRTDNKSGCFVLEKLKEQSTGNTVVKSALDTAEAEYEEWQEEKRIERQAGR